MCSHGAIYRDYSGEWTCLICGGPVPPPIENGRKEMLETRGDFCIIEEMEEHSEGKIAFVAEDGEFKRGKVISCSYIDKDVVVIYRNAKKLGLGHPDNFVIVEIEDVVATEHEDGK